MPHAPLWHFLCYRNNSGGNDIVPLLAKLTVKGRANARRAMEHLRQKDIQWWERPHASNVRGQDHIYVIRFKDENRTQWRLLGFHERALSVFVLTNTATERDGVYDPDNYGAIAARRMEQCRADWKGRVCSCLSGIPALSSLGQGA